MNLVRKLFGGRDLVDRASLTTGVRSAQPTIETGTLPPPAQEATDPGFVYLMYAQRTGLHKIGLTHRDPSRRERQLENTSGLSIDMISYTHVVDMRTAERELHEMLDAYRCEGEWFDLPLGVAGQIHRWMLRNAIATTRELERLQR